MGSLEVIANGCTEHDGRREAPHLTLGKIVDDADNFFADDGLGDRE